jgi:hypothetical protein
VHGASIGGGNDSLALSNPSAYALSNGSIVLAYSRADPNGGESFMRVNWVAVPKASRARRVNRHRDQHRAALERPLHQAVAADQGLEPRTTGPELLAGPMRRVRIALLLPPATQRYWVAVPRGLHPLRPNSHARTWCVAS